MDPTNEVMCPTCNVAVVNGVCPQCGAPVAEPAPAPAPAPEVTPEVVPEVTPEA